MKPSNHPGWTHVRLRRATKERLEEVMLMKAAYYERTGRGLPTPNGMPSIDEFVNWFLDQEEDHKERSRRARLRAKQRRLNEERGHITFQSSPDGVEYVIPEDRIGRKDNGTKA